jgi:hypothetical protein
MVSHRSKRTKPHVNVQALSLIDQQTLRRAAALLKMSVDDLVQGPSEDSSQAYATPASQSNSVSDSQGRVPATTYPENTQNWLSEAQFQQQSQFQPNPYVEQAEQTIFRSAPQSEHFDPGLWQGMQMVSTPGCQSSFLPQNLFPHPAPPFYRNNSGEHGQVFEMHSSGQAQTEAFPVMSYHGQDSNYDGNEIEIIGTDSSSEVSENETESRAIDAQPWENVQINAVEQLVSSENDPDSDYLFPDDSEVPPVEDLHSPSQLVHINAQLKEHRAGKGMS